MSKFIYLKTISELFKLFGLGNNIAHPLVAVVDFAKVSGHVSNGVKISAEFYSVMFKNSSNNNIRYGRTPFDFQNGSLICMAPGQVIEMDNELDESSENMPGWGLFFHPDLIRNTSLNDKIQAYTFFSYEMSESLHLSEKEKQVLYDCVLKIEAELQENIDVHSRDILVSTIELLLNHCSRFYGRQFITRKNSNNAVLVQVERLLSAYYKRQDLSARGLPTVKSLAAQVYLSPGYLSDLLKKETGKNAQDHIHFYLIEEAKSLLLSTNKSVGEIAYFLGFEYPQYFNRLFKQKTGKTPIAFRSMN